MSFTDKPEASASLSRVIGAAIVIGAAVFGLIKADVIHVGGATPTNVTAPDPALSTPAPSTPLKMVPPVKPATK